MTTSTITVTKALSLEVRFLRPYPAEGSQMEDYALYYASLGWRVFPVHTRTQSGFCTCRRSDCDKMAKHPHITAWQDNATTDAERIREWWSLWPNANIGAVRGGASGVVAIDVDPRNGGDEGIARREAEHCPLPQTVAASTGGGGSHHFFKHPGDRVRKDNKGLVAEGVDSQGDGSYVLLPPSLHASGDRYRWRPDADPAALPLAELPDWLYALVVVKRTQPMKASADNGFEVDDDEGWREVDRQVYGAYALAALRYACEAIAAAPRGQRNATMFTQAAAMGNFVGAGILDRGEVENALMDAAPVTGDFSEAEAWTAMQNGIDRGERNPRDLSGVGFSAGDGMT